MPVPGVRIVMKNAKRYAFVSVAAVGCILVLVVLFIPDFLQRDVQDLQQVLARNHQGKVENVAVAYQGNKTANLVDLELAKAKLENQLLSEKLKAEKLARELEEAIRQQQSGNAAVGLPPGQQPPQNSFQRRQFLRLGAIQQECQRQQRVPGGIHTVYSSRQGVTYCRIPRSFYGLWQKVFRFANRDFVEDVYNPFDIGTKSAIERPFIRTKVLRWPRVPQKDKMELLNTKVVVATENPYERLYNVYVNSFVLPELWATVGVDIEGKRKPANQGDVDSIMAQRAPPRILCGANITFSEFLKYALESELADYAPVYELCDSCQLNPTYLVKSETAKEDLETVLSHFNLAWTVQGGGYANQTIIRYITTTINDNFDRLQKARRTNCGSPSLLGARLWKAFIMEGIFPETSQYPKFEADTTKADLIQRATKSYLIYSKTKVNNRALKVAQIISAYNLVSRRIVEQIPRRYIMDFRLLGYSQKVDEIDKETY